MSGSDEDPYKNHYETKCRVRMIASAISKNSVVLDVGCGDWPRVAVELRKKDCVIHGIDTIEPHIDVLDMFFKGDMHEVLPKLVAENRKYDCIVFGLSLEYSCEPVKLLEHAYSLLRDNGKIIVNVPNLTSFQNKLKLLLGQPIISIFNTGGHGYWWTYNELKQALENIGFKDIKSMLRFASIRKFIYLEGRK